MKYDAPYFLSLSASQKREVHFRLCEEALQTWTAFAKQGPVSYTESVAGTEQPLDFAILADAMKCAKLGRDELRVQDRFREPKTALQDEDLELPEDVAFAFYCIFNLFRKYVENKDVDDWLIVNQALAARPDEPADVRLEKILQELDLP